jgi:hypothetical protein
MHFDRFAFMVRLIEQGRHAPITSGLKRALTGWEGTRRHRCYPGLKSVPDGHTDRYPPGDRRLASAKCGCTEACCVADMDHVANDTRRDRRHAAEMPNCRKTAAIAADLLDRYHQGGWDVARTPRRGRPALLRRRPRTCGRAENPCRAVVEARAEVACSVAACIACCG